MPNWNFNDVTIDAPEGDVHTFLVRDKNEYRFNMHKIFPETFGSEDATGDDGWDYDWACDNTGSKWFPGIHGCFHLPDGSTNLTYDTAWVPNNLTLLKLSKITGWKICNKYEEPGMCFEGTFICEAGEVLLDEVRENCRSCETCSEIYHICELPEDAEEYFLCPRCYRKGG